MPETLRVRHLTFSFEEKGFRTKKVTVATTLLDAQLYPIETIAQLYRQRWRVELYLRDIKIALRMDILRCKSPEMIHKELSLFMTLYNLIRWLMLQAATEEKLRPENLSFTGTVATLRQWIPFFALADQGQRDNLRIHMLLCIQNDPLPHRPDRLEPRARKRRPKNYQLLTKHRKFFKEVTHRNHYRKSLS